MGIYVCVCMYVCTCTQTHRHTHTHMYTDWVCARRRLGSRPLTPTTIHPKDKQRMEKKTSSANRLVLKRILGQEGNGKCADCKTATHPRWASWNIGILICIRCSGIHRSLGTHISKVRSIDLDTWNETQLEKLVEFGNTRANAYWESKLPPNYVPDESKIVNFIKTKYELRRWIPDDDDKPLAATAGASLSSAKPPKIPPRLRDPPKSSVDLLDLDGAFNVKRSEPTQMLQQQQPQLHQSISAQIKPQPVQHRALPETPQPSGSAQQQNRTDVKKSILSLYSQPSRQSTPSNSSFTAPMGSSTPASASTSTSMFSSPFTLGQPTAQQPATQPKTQQSTYQPQPLDLDDEEDNFAHVWR